MMKDKFNEIPVAMVKQGEVLKLLFDYRSRFEEYSDEDENGDETYFEKEELVDVLNSLIVKVQKLDKIFIKKE